MVWTDSMLERGQEGASEKAVSWRMTLRRAGVEQGGERPRAGSRLGVRGLPAGATERSGCGPSSLKRECQG